MPLLLLLLVILLSLPIDAGRNGVLGGRRFRRVLGKLIHRLLAGWRLLQMGLGAVPARLEGLLHLFAFGTCELVIALTIRLITVCV